MPAELSVNNKSEFLSRWIDILRAVLAFIFVIALTFLGLLIVTFFIGRVIPIDPVLSVVGDRASQEIYDAAAAKLGLDRPLVVQFLKYVGDVLQGDLGHSISTNRPFIPALISEITSDIHFVELEHQPSSQEKSRYTFRRRLMQFSNLNLRDTYYPIKTGNTW